MVISTFTEQALRSAMNTTKTELSEEVDPAKTLKQTAIKRVEELIKGNSTSGNKNMQMDVQAMAINAAIQGIELAFYAIQGQLKELKNKRLSFDKERQAGIATFIIPTNKEEKELSKQERIIKSFIELTKKNPLFAPYLGIKTSVSSELDNAEFHSVLPFYKMSEQLPQRVCSNKAIDKQRTTISLFFRSAMPDAIANIDNNFQNDSSFLEFWKSAYKKENYLNDLRAPRFIMMSLANLLWNLQHPVDTETGYPLSIGKNIKLCLSVSAFLNKLLNSNEITYLKPLSDSTSNLFYFVRKVEIHVKSLQKAFSEEHLNELNIADLNNNAHNTLRIMDKCIFELIYSRKNPLTHKMQPDSKAAEELAYKVSYINQQLADMPELLGYFKSIAANTGFIPYLNPTPRTVIDILILYIHSSHEDKERLFKALNAHPSDSLPEFIYNLKTFEKQFIRPIKDVSKKELNAGIFDRKSKEVRRLTARRLIPLITLVLEDYSVEVNRPITLAFDQTTADSVLYTAKEQIEMINKSASGNGDIEAQGYYAWELSPFVTFNKETEEVLDDLPKRQYRFTEITKLLDAVSEIVLNYRSFLQYKSFQEFLLSCLDKIKKEYSNLTEHIGKVNDCLTKDKVISRNIQSILSSMTSDFGKGYETFSNSFINFEQKISAPDFSEQQKLSLTTKLNFIHQQFTTLFEEDSGILSFIRPTTPLQKGNSIKELSSTATDEEPTTVPPPEKQYLPPKHIVELRKLINRCIDALSYQSRYGVKGKLLAHLLTLIDSKATHTQDDIASVIKELARITLSYRPTYFFQAEYAETRSAKELIAALKDKKANKLLNLKEILLGSDTEEIINQSNADIAQRLRNARVANNWHDSCDKIQTFSL